MEHPPKSASISAAPQYTLADLADAFFAAYSGRDRSLVTRIGHWVAILGNRPLVDITEDDLETVLLALAKGQALTYSGGAIRGGNVTTLPRRRSPATVNRYRAALATLIKWARSERLIPKRWESPIKFTDRLSESSGRLRYLSKEEYERLRVAARVSAWPKLWLFITMAVSTGARRGALLGLRWTDIDLDAARASIERTKNGTAFTLALTPSVVDELRKFHRPNTDELVFRSKASPDRAHTIVSAYKTACRIARLENVCIHTLRHSHASWLAQSGASLMQIAESMNHKSLSMVKRYAHLAVDDRARIINEVFEK